MPVSVVKITVQYVFKGVLHELDFDPATTKSIVFEQLELDRALLAQNIATGQVPQQNKVNPAGPFGPTVKSIQNLGAAPATVNGPPIWWHDSNCRWSHPEQPPGN